MAKRLLSVVSLLVQTISLCFIFSDFDFSWTISHYYFELIYNANFFFIIICIPLFLLFLNCLGSVISIFKNVRFINTKAYILLSIITFLAFISTCFYGVFSIGLIYEIEGVIVFYIVSGLLLFNILLECVKRFSKTSSADEYAKAKTKEVIEILKNKSNIIMIAFLGILGAGIGAVIAELTVSWTVSIGAGADGRSVFNPAALIFVAIGLIVGILIGLFTKKLLSTIKESKNTPDSSDATSQIIKYKELLDSGAITQEEFDEKKKQLLNL